MDNDYNKDSYNRELELGDFIVDRDFRIKIIIGFTINGPITWTRNKYSWQKDHGSMTYLKDSSRRLKISKENAINADPEFMESYERNLSDLKARLNRSSAKIISAI